jgi:hypothetical protein
MALAVAGIAFSATARADVELTYSYRSILLNHRVIKEVISIGADDIKVASSESVLIFSESDDTLYDIDLKNRTYQKFGAAARKRIQDKMMHSLSASRHRDLAPKHIKTDAENCAPTSPPRPAWQPHGQPETIAPWRCEPFRLSLFKVAAFDACLAPSTQISISESQWRVIEDLDIAWQQVIFAMMPNEPPFGIPLAQDKELRKKGFPVEVTYIFKDKPFSITTVIKAGRLALPKNAFDIPAGFKEKPLPKTDPPGTS